MVKHEKLVYIVYTPDNSFNVAVKCDSYEQAKELAHNWLKEKYNADIPLHHLTASICDNTELLEV